MTEADQARARLISNADQIPMIETSAFIGEICVGN